MKTGAFSVYAGVSSGGVTATVGHGTVNGFEPTVSGEKISKGPIILGPKSFDEYGRLYVCVRVKIDVTTGKMIVPPGDDGLTIVISPYTRLASEANAGLESSEKAYWNHPIATLSDTGFLSQVAHFNLMHYTSKRGVVGGPGIWYHYFYAA
jgi:hypothetical protein